MSEYSEIEIQTAKNMLKKGYKWIIRNKDLLYAFRSKPCKRLGGSWYSNTEVGLNVCYCVPIFENIKNSDSEPTSLANIVNPSPLDETEKRYLSAVIRPFKFDIWFIRKVNSKKKYGYQQIVISTIDDSDDIVLPLFKKDTMYKGMEADHFYKLDELGIE